MAVAAHSTIARPARAKIDREAYQAEARRGRGVIVLDGPVFFDAAQQPMPGDLILVRLPDGSFQVTTLAKPFDVSRPSTVYVECPPPFRGTRACAVVSFVGVVTTPDWVPSRVAGQPAGQLAV